MQTKISTWESAEADRLAELTEAEREVWEKVENGVYGPRRYARLTGRSPGTVGNLLARAREKLRDQEGSA